MIIVMNEMFEAAPETDIYAMDVSKIPSTNKFKAILQNVVNYGDIGVDSDDFDEFQEAKDAALLYKKNFPCTIDKIITVYYE